MTDKEKVKKIQEAIKLAEKWNKEKRLSPQCIAMCTFRAVRRFAFAGVKGK